MPSAARSRSVPGPTTAASSQLATLSNGNFVAVFEDEFAGLDNDVLFRIMTPTGTSVTGPFTVFGANSNFDEEDPAVAALVGGNFVVAWTDIAGDSSIAGVRASIYTNAGSVLTGDFLVNTTEFGDQTDPTLTALPDGGFVVTWEDGFANLVRAQRFDAAGARIGSEFTVKPLGFSFGDEVAATLRDGRIAYANKDTAAGDHDITTSIWDPYAPRPDDFNKDVRSDILWRQDGGAVGQWFMNGGLSPPSAIIAREPLTAVWQIEGIGDFNGDARNDILLRHADGYLGTWHMDGATVLSTHVFGEGTPNAWHIQGVADFNGDSQSDILWRHDDGTVGTWHMNGATALSTHAFSPELAPLVLAHPGHRRLQWRRPRRHPVSP